MSAQDGRRSEVLLGFSQGDASPMTERNASSNALGLSVGVSTNNRAHASTSTNGLYVTPLFIKLCVQAGTKATPCPAATRAMIEVIWRPVGPARRGTPCWR